MPHKNYYEIKADSYYELGLKEGRLFSAKLLESIKIEKQKEDWSAKITKSKDYLKITEDVFPNFIEELRGYAKGAGARFEDLWVLCLENELSNIDKCTTVITNDGKLIAHNEDWGMPNAKDAVCILKKTIKDSTIFELFYFNTLGGNSISINSNGLIQAVNSLFPTDKQYIGIPGNITARWLSETKDPVNDFDKFLKFKRSSGYNHIFVNSNGAIWSIESSAKRQNMVKVASPYVHTNHYLTDLKELENNDNSHGTFDRYKFANEKVKKSMSLDEVKNLMNDGSMGDNLSLFNKRTIARMIIDLNKLKVYVWLSREKEKNWVTYDIDFLRKL